MIKKIKEMIEWFVCVDRRCNFLYELIRVDFVQINFMAKNRSGDRYTYRVNSFIFNQNKTVNKTASKSKNQTNKKCIHFRSGVRSWNQR